MLMDISIKSERVSAKNRNVLLRRNVKKIRETNFQEQ